MVFLDENDKSYSPEIMQAFADNRAKDILQKYIYDYREHAHDSSFHFLVGMALMHMGYYEEAHVAFMRTQKEETTASHRGDVFDSLVMLMAQRDNEAKEKLATIPLSELTTKEIIAVMSIKNKLELPMAEELDAVLNAPFNTEADRLVMSLLAFKYAFFEKAASIMAKSINETLFKDFATFLYVVKEIYKLHMVDEADDLLRNVNVRLISNDPQKFKEYIRTCYACGYYTRMDANRRMSLLGHARKRHSEGTDADWEEILSILFCMEYDRREKSCPSKKGKIVKKMKRLRDKSEQVLLYISTYDFEHYSAEKALEVKENLERLISLNQTNLRYRKLYCDLLTVMGHLRLADEVTKATVAMRKKQEADEFALISTFRSFYMPKVCMLSGMPVHEHDNGEDCPICFGSGSQPIIRSIGAGHSPSSIFTDNLESHVIEPNEAMLKDLVNWQPMNIASPIVGKYLLSLGAYMSTRKYPDVLVPGQTYLYLSLKSEAERRLLKEGYSLLQVDPFAVVNANKGATPTTAGKSLKTIPVSAKDFVLEIIHAISPEGELNSEQEDAFPMPN